MRNYNLQIMVDREIIILTSVIYLLTKWLIIFFFFSFILLLCHCRTTGSFIMVSIFLLPEPLHHKVKNLLFLSGAGNWHLSYPPLLSAPLWLPVLFLYPSLSFSSRMLVCISLRFSFPSTFIRISVQSFLSLTKHLVAVSLLVIFVAPNSFCSCTSCSHVQ